MIREIAGEHAEHRHVDDVRAEREDASILEHQRLDGEDGGHDHARRGGSERERQKRAAEEVAARADADREVDHLGGEDERAHHAEERDTRVIKGSLRAADGNGDARNRGRVEGGPHRGRQKSVGYVHRFSR